MVSTGPILGALQNVAQTYYENQLQQYQQQYQSSQQLWNTWTTTATVYGTQASAKKPEAIPETPLAWLDRRVNEMRVAL